MKSIFLAVLVLPALSFAALTESQNYIEAYTNYVRDVKKDVQKIAEQNKKVNEVNTGISKTERTLLKLDKEIRNLESTLEAIPADIAKHEQKILANNKSYERIKGVYFPDLANGQEAKARVLRKLKALKSKKSDLESRYNFERANYEERIQDLKSKNSNLERKKGRTEAEIAEIEEDVRGLRNELIKVRQAIQEIQMLQNRPQVLNRRIAAARRNLGEKRQRLEKTKQALGSENCNGFLDGFKTRCRRYFRAKAAFAEARSELQNYLNIQNGGGLRPLTSKRERLQREIRYRQSDLPGLNRDLRRAENEIQNNQSSIIRLEGELNAISGPYLSKIAELDIEIYSEGELLNKAQTLVNLQRENQSLRKRIEDAKQNAQSYPGLINSKKAERVDVNKNLQTQKQQLSLELDEFNKLEAELKESKAQVIDAENALRVALVEAENIEVGTDSYSEVSDVLYSYKAWSVLGALQDATWGAPTCKATTEVVDEQLQIKLNLEVTNLEIGESEYAEPVVLITVDALTENSAENLSLLYSVKASAHSEKEFEFLFAPSLSNDTSRVFISRLEDREALIDDIIRKYVLNARFATQEGVELFDFSLSGSSNTIQGSQSSLASQCGGIEIY